MKYLKIYYTVKRFISIRLQIFLRRRVAKYIRNKSINVWPIDRNISSKPKGFKGWPGNKQFAFILRHDVDTSVGHAKCYQLAKLEKQLGFKSSFNFVPERYIDDPSLRQYLISQGFEIGVHGLKHDGKLYFSPSIFRARAHKINNYLHNWHSVGFYSPSSHHNLVWLHDLNIKYDSSTFDTDPFEPQPDGVGTIFPMKVQNNDSSHFFIELPYTLAQDFTLFILLQETTNDIWKRKLDWIAEHGGMAFLNTHPDYMHFGGSAWGIKEYSSHLYFEFLDYVKTKYHSQYWHALPKDVALFWESSFTGK